MTEKHPKAEKSLVPSEANKPIPDASASTGLVDSSETEAERRNLIVLPPGISVETVEGHQLVCAALNVRQRANDVAMAAMEMCVAMYLCREAFNAAANSKEGEWQQFRQANFSGIYDSEARARESVRIGRAIHEARRADKPVDSLKKLSRNALAAWIGACPQTRDVVIEMLDETDKPMTGREIEALNQELIAARASEENAVRMRDDANLRADQMDASMVELTNRLAQTDALVQKLTREKESLERSKPTVVDSIVPMLPPGVKTEAEALERVRQELTRETHRREKIESDIKSRQALLDELQRKVRDHLSADKSLTALSDEIDRIAAKWSLTVSKAIADVSADSRQRLKDLHASLMTLASQIDPQQL